MTPSQKLILKKMALSQNFDNFRQNNGVFMKKKNNK